MWAVNLVGVTVIDTNAVFVLAMKWAVTVVARDMKRSLLTEIYRASKEIKRFGDWMRATC